MASKSSGWTFGAAVVMCGLALTPDVFDGG